VVVENWASAFFTLFSLMPSHPAIPHHLVTPLATRPPPPVQLEASAAIEKDMMDEGVSEQLAAEISRYDGARVPAEGKQEEQEQEVGAYFVFTLFLAGGTGGLLLSVLASRCVGRKSKRKARGRDIPL
jgi:hypothetical protein